MEGIYCILKLKNRHLLIFILIVMCIVHCTYLIVLCNKSEQQLLIVENSLMRKDINVKYACVGLPCTDFTRNIGNRQKENIQITNTRPPVKQNHCNTCWKSNIPLLMEPKELCQDRDIKLVIFITSVHPERHNRDVIRQTWLTVIQDSTVDVRYFFILGRQENGTYSQEIRKESVEKNDIVLFDFIDTYNNLSVKTIQGFTYAIKRCQRAKYIMKTDTDVYVNLDSILSDLITHNTKFTHTLRSKSLINQAKYPNYTKANFGTENRLDSEQEMFGLLWHETVPYRNRSKWFVSVDEYPEDFYPDYFDGHAYILSMKVAQNVVKISRNIPFFKFEDVFIGMCLKKLGYHLHYTPGFIRIDKKLTFCSHKFQQVYTVHRVTVDRMIKIWNATCSLHGVPEVEVEQTKRSNQWIKIGMQQKIKNITSADRSSDHQTVKPIKFSYIRKHN